LVGQIKLTNLDASEPQPTAQSLEWDASVDTYAELTYINTAEISGTTNYLVKADETANNYWAIYNWDGTDLVKDQATDLQHLGVLELHGLVQNGW
jgi:hypothetical protein